MSKKYIIYNIMKISEKIKIPRKIFMYWHNSNYPYIIQYNIDRIKELHPDYDIVILNNDTYKKYVNLENFNLNDKLLNTPAYFSDILRFLLLEKYGGIWIDASLLIWKKIDNIINHENTLFLVRNYNNDNYTNKILECKGYESWLIAAMPRHPFITKMKDTIIRLNTYKKIKHFLSKKCFAKQKNVKHEYHLIYHIISYVECNYSETLQNCQEYDSKLLYLNHYIYNDFNIPFTNANTYVLNFSFPVNYLTAQHVKKFIKYKEPDNILATKLTSDIRKYI